MNPYRIRKLVSIVFALAVFAGSLAFYIVTGPSDIAWLDGAHYQRRVVVTEIGEGPWDRPLYVIVSQPFLLLPWGSLARRASLASAAFAASTCLLIYLLMKVFLQVAPQVIARRVGILAAISLGVAHTFWLRAVTPGPEVLDALLLAAVLYCLVRFDAEGRVRYLYAAMMILGLSLANNLMMVFLIPVFAIYVRVVKPPLVRDIGVVRARGLLVFLAGSAVALAVAAWGWYAADFRLPAERLSWLTFWRDHMLLSWDVPLQQSLIRFGTALLYNFPPWIAVLGLIGLAELFRRQKYIFWLILPLLFVHSALAVTLTLNDPFSAYLPSFVLISITVGYGWWKVLTDAKWAGFVFAILLSISPLLIYRFAGTTIRWLGEEVSVSAFLAPPFESPLDPLEHFLNPDRRRNPDARDFAQKALAELPERGRVVAPSQDGEFLAAPMRYLAEVEDVEGIRAGLIWSRLRTEDEGELERWAAENETPLYLIGLHPPNPAVERLLDRYDFVPTGPWFRVQPRRLAQDLPPTDMSEPEAEPTALTPLAGEWTGFVRPQGYALSFLIDAAPDGSLSGRAFLNPTSALPREGQFTRLSPIGDTVVGTVTYGEHVHIQIDAKRSDNLLEGTWQIFEAQHLGGRFTVWKR